MHLASDITKLTGSAAGQMDRVLTSVTRVKQAVLKRVARPKQNGQQSEPSRPAAVLLRIRRVRACIHERERFHVFDPSYRHRPRSAPR